LYKNKKLKLYFEDCATVLNDFIYQTGGIIYTIITTHTVKSSLHSEATENKTKII
jgi:hypothetical protein